MLVYKYRQHRLQNHATSSMSPCSIAKRLTGWRTRTRITIETKAPFRRRVLHHFSAVARTRITRLKLLATHLPVYRYNARIEGPLITIGYGCLTWGTSARCSTAVYRRVLRLGPVYRHGRCSPEMSQRAGQTAVPQRKQMQLHRLQVS